MNDKEGEEFIKSIVVKRSLDFKLHPKAKKQRFITNSIINDDHYGSNTEDKQYVQVLDRKLLQESSANVRKQEPLVIPLHLASRTDDLQKRAEEELLREIKGIENTGSSSLIISSTSSSKATASKEKKKAPLLLANVRPEVRALHDDNDRFRADLEYRADDMNVKSNAYDSVPVEHFGAALLRGMGWTNDTQENKANVLDTRVAKHEHRQGLGATGQPPQLKNRHQHNSQSQLNEWDKKVQDKLKQQSLSVGSIVLLQDRNMIGKRAVVTVIAGVPGLNKVRVAVEEANEEIIVSKETLLLITDEELLLHPFKYGILEKVSSGTSLYFGESSSFNRRPVEVSDSQQLPTDHFDSKAASQNLTIKSTEMLQQRTNWLRTGIRVKLVSKKFGIGLYSKKAFVVDVPSKKEATIRFDDGHMIENVKEKYLETVLPPSGGLCLVLTGDNAGETANLIEKRDNEQAVIELTDSLVVLVVSMDSIAAFSEL